MALNAKKWYVLHVVSGKEQDIGEQLLSKGIESFVPIENRVIRQRGKWIQKPYVVFKGYVFVHIHYTWPLFYEIGKIKNVYRMLGSLDEDRSEGGTKKGSEVFVPVPLSREEEKRLFKECRLLAEPPVVRLKEDGEWQLAPAYDLTGSKFPSDDPWSAHGGRHQLSVNGKQSKITDDDLLAVADRFAIGTAPRILREVKSALP